MANVLYSFRWKQCSSISLRSVILATFFVHLILSEQACCLTKGQPCVRSQDGVSGVCRLLSECPDIRDEPREPTRLDFCDSNGQMPIVCCAAETSGPQHAAAPLSFTSDQRQSVSRRKCKEYAEMVYEEKISNEKNEISKQDGCVKSANSSKAGNALLGEFPHMAMLLADHGEKSYLFCGGSLISERYVLSTAVCVSEYMNSRIVVYVVLGQIVQQDESDGAKPQRMSVAQIIVHPDYQPPRVYFDIALLLMTREPQLGWRVRPACLAPAGHGEQEYLAIGWGKTGFDAGHLSKALLKVPLIEAPIKECNNSYTVVPNTLLELGIDPHTQLCAGHPYKKLSICQGDAGGPLQVLSRKAYCMYDIVGISSFGVRMCDKIPGVFTRVAYFVNWIEDIVWPE